MMIEETKKNTDKLLEQSQKIKIKIEQEINDKMKENILRVKSNPVYIY